MCKIQPNMFKPNILRFTLAIVGLSYTIRAANLRRQLNSSSSQQIIPFGSFEFWVYAFISLFLSCFAGVCSGLTVGYMAISKSQMQLWAASDEENKKKMGKTILQILSDHHYLLSTLLLANALSLQALPIFLDKIVPSYLAIFISTASVVVFGEVIPQAYCTGPKKTSIGYSFAPFIKFLQFILYPFVKPIVVILDKLIEHDQGKLVLDKDKIKAVLLLHNKKQYGYRPEQIQILQNCLDIKEFKVSKVMLPLDKVFMLEVNTKVDEGVISKLLEQGFSKIPLYEGSRDNVVGFVKAKNLIEFDINNPKSFKQCNSIISPTVSVSEKENLLETIDFLKTKKINFAIVTNDLKKCVGIITLKQIFEKIVLKKFKDDDIRVHIHINKQVRVDSVMQARQQD